MRDRLDVLERRLPRGSTTSHDEIVRWFEEGLRQLSDARVLDRFFEALDAKHGTTVAPSTATTTDRPDTAKLLKAVEFAASKHRDQRRKGADASPYVNHPIAVAHLLAEAGGVTDLDTLVAAVLHDTLEDTETTIDELDQRFGSAVRRIVEEVTDDKTLENCDPIVEDAEGRFAAGCGDSSKEWLKVTPRRISLLTCAYQKVRPPPIRAFRFVI